MLKFISFNSGSCGNCYFLFTENDGLMIDAGVGTRSLKKFFNEYGIPMTAMLGITHIMEGMAYLVSHGMAHGLAGG